MYLDSLGHIPSLSLPKTSFTFKLTQVYCPGYMAPCDLTLTLTLISCPLQASLSHSAPAKLTFSVPRIHQHCPHLSSFTLLFPSLEYSANCLKNYFLLSFKFSSTIRETFTDAASDHIPSHYLALFSSYRLLMCAC